MEQLICENLTIGYPGHPIATDLSFTIREGDYVCIIGENGAGKSTLMKTLLGLLPPLAGSLKLGAGLSPRSIGYLPQQTLVQQDFPASVREIVLSGCQAGCGLRPFYTKAEKRLADYAMTRMEIKEKQHACFRELSGGQKQRVLLARALCATGHILCLDEPVAGLDPTVSQHLYGLLSDLNQKNGTTILMVSHDVETALSKASHVLALGKNFFYGTVEEYKAACRKNNGASNPFTADATATDPHSTLAASVVTTTTSFTVGGDPHAC